MKFIKNFIVLMVLSITTMMAYAGQIREFDISITNPQDLTICDGEGVFRIELLMNRKGIVEPLSKFEIDLPTYVEFVDLTAATSPSISKTGSSLSDLDFKFSSVIEENDLTIIEFKVKVDCDAFNDIANPRSTKSLLKENSYNFIYNYTYANTSMQNVINHEEFTSGSTPTAVPYNLYHGYLVAELPQTRFQGVEDNDTRTVPNQYDVVEQDVLYRVKGSHGVGAIEVQTQLDALSDNPQINEVHLVIDGNVQTVAGNTFTRNDLGSDLYSWNVTSSSFGLSDFPVEAEIYVTYSFDISGATCSEGMRFINYPIINKCFESSCVFEENVIGQIEVDYTEGSLISSASRAAQLEPCHTTDGGASTITYTVVLEAVDAPLFELALDVVKVDEVGIHEIRVNHKKANTGLINTNSIVLELSSFTDDQDRPLLEDVNKDGVFGDLSLGNPITVEIDYSFVCPMDADLVDHFDKQILRIVPMFKKHECRSQRSKSGSLITDTYRNKRPKDGFRISGPGVIISGEVESYSLNLFQTLGGNAYTDANFTMGGTMDLPCGVEIVGDVNYVLPGGRGSTKLSFSSITTDPVTGMTLATFVPFTVPTVDAVEANIVFDLTYNGVAGCANYETNELTSLGMDLWGEHGDCSCKTLFDRAEKVVLLIDDRDQYGVVNVEDFDFHRLTYSWEREADYYNTQGQRLDYNSQVKHQPNDYDVQRALSGDRMECIVTGVVNGIVNEPNAALILEFIYEVPAFNLPYLTPKHSIINSSKGIGILGSPDMSTFIEDNNKYVSLKYEVDPSFVASDGDQYKATLQFEVDETVMANSSKLQNYEVSIVYAQFYFIPELSPDLKVLGKAMATEEFMVHHFEALFKAGSQTSTRTLECGKLESQLLQLRLFDNFHPNYKPFKNEFRPNAAFLNDIKIRFKDANGMTGAQILSMVDISEIKEVNGVQERVLPFDPNIHISGDVLTINMQYPGFPYYTYNTNTIADDGIDIDIYATNDCKLAGGAYEVEIISYDYVDKLYLGKPSGTPTPVATGPIDESFYVKAPYINAFIGDGYHTYNKLAKVNFEVKNGRDFGNIPSEEMMTSVYPVVKFDYDPTQVSLNLPLDNEVIEVYDDQANGQYFAKFTSLDFEQNLDKNLEVKPVGCDDLNVKESDIVISGTNACWNQSISSFGSFCPDGVNTSTIELEKSDVRVDIVSNLPKGQTRRVCEGFQYLVQISNHANAPLFDPKIRLELPEGIVLTQVKYRMDGFSEDEALQLTEHTNLSLTTSSNSNEYSIQGKPFQLLDPSYWDDLKGDGMTLHGNVFGLTSQVDDGYGNMLNALPRAKNEVKYYQVLYSFITNCDYDGESTIDFALEGTSNCDAIYQDLNSTLPQIQGLTLGANFKPSFNFVMPDDLEQSCESQTVILEYRNDGPVLSNYDVSVINSYTELKVTLPLDYELKEHVFINGLPIAYAGSSSFTLPIQKDDYDYEIILGVKDDSCGSVEDIVAQFNGSIPVPTGVLCNDPCDNIEFQQTVTIESIKCGVDFEVNFFPSHCFDNGKAFIFNTSLPLDQLSFSWRKEFSPFSFSNESSVHGLSPGIYYVTVWETSFGERCAVPKKFKIIGNKAPYLNLEDSYCENDDKFEIEILPPNNYWNTDYYCDDCPNGSLDQKSGEFDPGIAGPGVHNIRVHVNIWSDYMGDWCGVILHDEIRVVAAPEVDFSFSKNPICSGDDVTLTANSDAPYLLWSTGATSDEIIETPNTSMFYWLKGYNDEGCTTGVAKIINVQQKYELEIIPKFPTICEGEEIVLTAKDADYANWHPGNIQGTSITVSPTSDQAYSVGAVKGVCQSSTQVTVRVIPKPKPFDYELEICDDNADENCSGSASIEFTPAGVAPDISLTWQEFGTDIAAPFNLCKGNYSVTIEDTRICSDFQTTIEPFRINKIGEDGVYSCIPHKAYNEFNWLTDRKMITSTVEYVTAENVDVEAKKMEFLSEGVIYLNPGFEAKNLNDDKYFLAEIRNCANECTNARIGKFEESTEDDSNSSNPFETSFKQAKLYPNPTSGSFKLQIPFETGTNVRVLDMVGKQVINAEFEFGEHELDITDFNSGIYMVQIQNGDNVQTIKLLKE